MRKIMVMVGALCLFGALAVTAPAQGTSTSTQGTMSGSAQKSLYERLGGLDAITAVVDEFAARVLKDDRINKKFAKSDVPRLRLHLIEFVCKATGGPCEYTGLDMKKSHKNMGVTEGEFNALVEDLVGALDKFNVPEQEKKDLLTQLGPLKPQIVEINSQETGQPLPANFKPAKPLSQSQISAGPKMKGGKMKGNKMKNKDKSSKKENTM